MAPLRLLQVSDLHVGTRDEPGIEEALRRVVRELEPELVIASGDLTHRNRREHHEQAGRLLRSLGPPVLAVPGNHDMPALPPWRFTRTFAEFERIWGDLEPVHRSARLVACGLNSARPWLYQEGFLGDRQIERVRAELSQAPEGALRVIVLHHHLVSAPWRTAKRPVFRRTHVVRALVDAGADLIVSGHVHQSVVVERRELEVVGAEARGTTVANAPGLGRPRPGRHGEARGLHAYEAEGGRLRVLTYVWRGEGFAVVADRAFPLGAGPLERGR
jgi:3',5'-cyclic AMP phosphodiesterase CpdA